MYLVPDNQMLVSALVLALKPFSVGVGQITPGTGDWIAYSTPSLPLIPEQACHPFQTKAATDSRAKLPPWQIASKGLLELPDAG